MNDTVNTAAAKLKEKLDGAAFDGSIKFDIDDAGAIRIVDGTVTTDDGEADCTISASLDTFQDLFDGELDPTAAYMTGRIKIDGDLSVAMKLGQILG